MTLIHRRGKCPRGRKCTVQGSGCPMVAADMEEVRWEGKEVRGWGGGERRARGGVAAAAAGVGGHRGDGGYKGSFFFFFRVA